MEGALSPRLVGISGPVEGEVFGLSDGHLSIGRDSSNQLPIDDPSIAPCHCRIRRREGEEFEIQDLGSGATTVNGVPVTVRTLSTVIGSAWATVIFYSRGGTRWPSGRRMPPAALNPGGRSARSERQQPRPKKPPPIPRPGAPSPRC